MFENKGNQPVVNKADTGKELASGTSKEDLNHQEKMAANAKAGQRFTQVVGKAFTELDNNSDGFVSKQEAKDKLALLNLDGKQTAKDVELKAAVKTLVKHTDSIAKLSGNGIGIAFAGKLDTNHVYPSDLKNLKLLSAKLPKATMKEVDSSKLFKSDKARAAEVGETFLENLKTGQNKIG